ncbi:MAG: hypothetical protein LBE34_11825 [Flavobacteriaceae bacterium]|jgi:hypothetical protein|nr:hypothetical protein [Flavobacteriaceae bacterium]
MAKFKVKEIIIGFLLGLIATIIGSELYLRIFTNYDLFIDFDFIHKAGLIGKVTAIGSLLNLLLLTFFINRTEDYKARGCVLAVILLTIITFFL